MSSSEEFSQIQSEQVDQEAIEPKATKQSQTRQHRDNKKRKNHNDNKDNRLIRAVDHNDYELAEALVKEGVDVNQYFFKGTALNRACRIGNLEIVKLLIKHRASISIADGGGFTALHTSIHGRKESIINYLLHLPTCHSANFTKLINKPDKEGWTVMHIAARNGNVSVLKRLVELGGDLTAQTFELKQTPLLMSMEKNNKCTVDYIKSVLNK